MVGSTAHPLEGVHKEGGRPFGSQAPVSGKRTDLPYHKDKARKTDGVEGSGVVADDEGGSHGKQDREEGSRAACWDIWALCSMGVDLVAQAKQAFERTPRGGGKAMRLVPA